MYFSCVTGRLAIWLHWDCRWLLVGCIRTVGDCRWAALGLSVGCIRTVGGCRWAALGLSVGCDEGPERETRVALPVQPCTWTDRMHPDATCRDKTDTWLHHPPVPGPCILLHTAPVDSRHADRRRRGRGLTAVTARTAFIAD